MKLLSQLFSLILMINICYCYDPDIRSVCLQKHNIYKDELEAIPRDPEVDDIPLKIRCYFKCLQKPFFGNDGKIDPKLLNEDYQKRRYVQCMEEFDDIVDPTGCDYATHIHLCIRL